MKEFTIAKNVVVQLHTLLSKAVSYIWRRLLCAMAYWAPRLRLATGRYGNSVNTYQEKQRIMLPTTENRALNLQNVQALASKGGFDFETQVIRIFAL